MYRDSTAGSFTSLVNSVDGDEESAYGLGDRSSASSSFVDETTCGIADDDDEDGTFVDVFTLTQEIVVGAQKRVIEKGTRGRIIEERPAENMVLVAFDGQTYNARVRSTEKAKFAWKRLPSFKGIELVTACLRIGWFLDHWVLDSHDALEHFKCVEKDHALRGLFEPSQKGLSRATTCLERRFTDVVSGPPKKMPLYLLIIVVVVLSACCPQLYCWYLSSYLGSEGCRRGTWCLLIVEEGAGFALGWACLLVTFAFHQATKALYRCLNHWWPAYAKSLRKFWISQVTDKIYVNKLKMVAGKHQKLASCIMFININMAFVLISIMTHNVGLAAFTQTVTMMLLVFWASVIGEKRSALASRKTLMLDIAMSIARKADIEIQRAELQNLLFAFLEQPSDVDTVVMDLRLLVILAAGIAESCNDSVRLKAFLVKSAYAEITEELTADRKTWIGSIKGYRDIFVDVFKKECVVLGGERPSCNWVSRGRRVPWHLAVRPSQIHNAQFSLFTAGMQPGWCAFHSTGGFKQPHWESHEASRQVFKHRQVAENIGNGTREASEALTKICILDREGDVEQDVRWLLEGGAQVNFPRQSSPALFACIENNLVSTAKLLLEHRASLAGKYEVGHGQENPLEYAQRLDRSGQDRKQLIEALTESDEASKNNVALTPRYQI